MTTACVHFRATGKTTLLDVARKATDYPWEKWTVFLHPEQKRTVQAEFNGPARVSGSAGTGKTVVALHRAVFLARDNPGARILLSTFSEALANLLRAKLRVLIGEQPRLAEQIEIYPMTAICKRLYRLNIGLAKIASPAQIDELLSEAAAEIDDHAFSLKFLRAEWGQVVDAWQLDSWEAYRDVLRLGRKTRLPESRRVVLWSIFERLRAGIDERGLVPYAGMFSQLAAHYRDSKGAPFDSIVVDESQDISIAQLRFLAALGGAKPNALFFAGDLGQRIFQQPFSWLALGVDIRGRSRTLRINYRTTHQIRTQADRLLGPEISDVDGITEKRSATISIFNGPMPGIFVFDTVQEENEAVGQWLAKHIHSGVLPDEIGVFVRSASELPRARAALEGAGLPYRVLDENVETTGESISLSTMHFAKGLEFRAVVVMACDDEVIPLMERIEKVTDTSDLEEVYNTERHLLYVACTRAREHLLITSVTPASEFLDDLRM